MPSPGSWSNTVSVSLSGTHYIDALLWGTKWAGSTITYSYPDYGSWWSTSTTTGYGPSSGDGWPWSSYFRPLSSSERMHFDAAVKAWSNVANLKIKLVSDTETSVGDIRVAYSYHPDHDDAAASTYLPADNATSGDIWYNVFGSFANSEWTPGSYAYFGALHELGHALGLIHPSPGMLSDVEDSMSFSVMSNSSSFEDSPYRSFYPTTPMMFDIAAVQYLYGANYSYKSGNTTYSFSDAAPYNETIWDGGGVDSIVYSGMLDSTIDLREGDDGGASSIGLPVYVESSTGAILYRISNVWIANGAIIENATGGSGNDKLIGNDVSNVLRGGNGNDTLDGGAGEDLMFGGLGNDHYFVSQPGELVREYIGEGSDSVTSFVSYVLPSNVDNLTLAGMGDINGTGNGLTNLITGNSGRNTLDGRAGADTLKGLGGQDILVWDGADTQVNGGGGGDTLKIVNGNLNLTLVENSKILNIETIDLTNSSFNKLTLDLNDILDISSSTDTLRVLGNAGDSVNIIGKFNSVGVFGEFHQYSIGGATLLVDTDILFVS